MLPRPLRPHGRPGALLRLGPGRGLAISGQCLGDPCGLRVLTGPGVVRAGGRLRMLWRCRRWRRSRWWCGRWRRSRWWCGRTGLPGGRGAVWSSRRAPVLGGLGRFVLLGGIARGTGAPRRLTVGRVLPTVLGRCLVLFGRSLWRCRSTCGVHRGTGLWFLVLPRRGLRRSRRTLRLLRLLGALLRLILLRLPGLILLRLLRLSMLSSRQLSPLLGRLLSPLLLGLLLGRGRRLLLVSLRLRIGLAPAMCGAALRGRLAVLGQQIRDPRATGTVIPQGTPAAPGRGLLVFLVRLFLVRTLVPETSLMRILRHPGSLPPSKTMLCWLARSLAIPRPQAVSLNSVGMVRLIARIDDSAANLFTNRVQCPHKLSSKSRNNIAPLGCR